MKQYDCELQQMPYEDMPRAVMEECDTGEWVSYEDYKKLREAAQAVVNSTNNHTGQYGPQPLVNAINALAALLEAADE